MAHKPSVKMIFCCGAKRSGKSTSVKGDDLKGKNRVIVFDTLGEYHDLKGFKQARKLADILKIIKAGWKKGFKIAYFPVAGDRIKQLDDLCKMILQVQMPYFESKDTRQVWLVVEELNESFPNTGGNAPRGAQYFPELCSRGGHYGVNIIGISQRPAEVHARFRGNVDVVRSYRLAFAEDIKTVGNMLPKGETPDFFNMETHEFIQIEGKNIKRGKNKLG